MNDLINTVTSSLHVQFHWTLLVQVNDPVVFRSSPQSVGNIYKGLAQSGAWGCFDEFNRIAVEVLSVVAVQVKCIQDAIRDKKTVFNFLGENIKLKATVGIFITMNPGYAGRTELPENLKALFRSEIYVGCTRSNLS